jgi:putative flippase GtrA
MIRLAIKFGLVGVVGFVVDSIVLMVMIEFGLDPYSGRAVSFMVAVTTTWLLNRSFTFRDRDPRLLGQWIKFASVNSLGGAVNYGTYAVLVANVQLFAAWPVLGVVVGSLAGMVFNLYLSKRYVFSEANKSPSVSEPVAPAVSSD